MTPQSLSHATLEPAALHAKSCRSRTRRPRHRWAKGERPLHTAPRLADAFGFERLLVKDEGLNPTGSFKARGLAMAVGRARELGATTVAHSFSRQCRRRDGRLCRASGPAGSGGHAGRRAGSHAGGVPGLWRARCSWSMA